MSVQPVELPLSVFSDFPFFDLFLTFVVSCVDMLPPFTTRPMTGHSVTESSTRVRKDGDDSQQDLTSGGVHDFMEPTLLAIPAHLKIDVSFL